LLVKQNQCKETKISGLETNIFELKMMVKSGLFYFEILLFSPFRVAAAKCKKICPDKLNWPGRLAGNSEGASRISK
jgi:hypothetical protein